MKSRAIPKLTCPYCGYLFDQAFGDRRPKGGNASLCLGCGKVSLFNEDLTMRVPTKNEQLEIDVNPQVIEAQIMLAGMRGGRQLEENK